MQHDYAAAVVTLQRAVELGHRSSWPVAKLGCALIGLGRTAEAEPLLDELVQRSQTEFICAPAIATLHLHLGHRDEFYRWMDRTLEERDPFAVSINREKLWTASATSRGSSSWCAAWDSRPEPHASCGTIDTGAPYSHCVLPSRIP